MRLAVSNIAWPKGEDERYLPLLASLGVEGVEVAPGRLWPDPEKATIEDASQWQARLQEYGLLPVGFHALLYERPDQNIVDSDCRGYLKHLARLCKHFGARQIVLGSPMSRRVTDNPVIYTLLALASLRAVTESCWLEGVDLLLEPLPSAEFISTSSEACMLMLAVDDASFGLCLDAGALISVGEVQTARYDKANHFHVNDPGNNPPGVCYPEEHKEIAAQLRGVGYDGWLTIETRQDPTDSMEAINRGVEFVRETYLKGE